MWIHFRNLLFVQRLTRCVLDCKVLQHLSSPRVLGCLCSRPSYLGVGRPQSTAIQKSQMEDCREKQMSLSDALPSSSMESAACRPPARTWRMSLCGMPTSAGGSPSGRVGATRYQIGSHGAAAAVFRCHWLDVMAPKPGRSGAGSVGMCRRGRRGFLRMGGSRWMCRFRNCLWC